MFQKRDSIDRMRIASPCPTNWEAMKGDDRTRFCDLCNLHVYNISEMTGKDVKTLIANTEGRICARLYKRTDGTVITKDCPVGLRAIRRRVSRVAGAVITAIFSFCMSVMGQSLAQEDKSCPSGTKITIEQLQDNRSLLQGVVLDPNGAVIAGVIVTLVNHITKLESKTVSNENGLFKFSAVEAGSYDLKVEAVGFAKAVVNQIKVETSQAVHVEVQMTFDGEGMTVGLLGLDPMIDTDGPGLKKTFSPQQATRLPF